MRLLVLLTTAALVAASCSSSDAEPAADVEADVSIDPGALATGRLSIEGQSVDYVTIAPDGFLPGDAAPVLLAFPPGRQDFDTTQRVASQTYLTEAVARGWVVFSPAAPEGGTLWFDESGELLPAVLDWIETWVSPENGRFHVAGISNGGLSTFALAARVPDRVQSMLVFPGFPRTEDEIAAFPDLLDIPVRMFVGGNDPSWIAPMEAANEAMTELGIDSTIEIFEGEGHIITALSDGVRVFEELDAVRSFTR